jgi:hypothetical protein
MNSKRVANIIKALEINDSILHQGSNLLLYGKRVGRPHSSNRKPSGPFMVAITNGRPKVKGPL